METKAIAIKGARILRDKLGKGWRIHVWENMGWHCECLKGPITVIPGGTGDFDKEVFWVLMTDDMRFVGCGSTCWGTGNTKYFKDPKKAVKETVARANQYFKKLKALIDTANDAVKAL